MNFVSESLGLDKNGGLTIGGLAVCDLAEEFGTPLYLMDEGQIRRNCRKFTEAMDSCCRGKWSVAYASKAFSCAHIYNIVHSEGLFADVASGGELYTALKGGMPPEKLIFHGNNKTDVELRYALGAGIGRFVANGTEELESLSGIAGLLNTTANVTIRVSPGVSGKDTHASLQTGLLDSKFGIPIETGAAYEAVKLALSLKNIKLMGIHTHLGSPIYEKEPYITAIGSITAFMAQVRDGLGYTLKELNAGGGYPVRYLDGQEEIIPISEYVKTIAKAVQDAGLRDLPELIIEPGRAIVADAGLTVYTVGSIKTIPDVRTYVSVDGGMTDNPRYMLYESKYEIILPERASEAKTEKITLAGRCCECEVLGEDMQIQPVKQGDLLAVLNTGAYNYAMASNYNRIPRPPVVMIRDGKPFVAVERETWEDLARLDR
jgi:diaminopimelate decarboxylase